MNDVKFADIKEGDTIYVLKYVSYGWHNKKEFFIPVKVGKVTPKSFYIGEKIFRKDRGNEIGGDARVYRQGEAYWSRFVKDEAHEARVFEYKLHAMRKIHELSGKITVPMIENVDPNTLKSVIQTLTGIVGEGESNGKLP